MTTLSVGRPAHLSSDDTHREVKACAGVREISDAAAVTIASWWAGPRRGNGLAFAELSTSGTVDYDELSAEIAREYAGSYGRDRDALNMLGTWALDKLRTVEGW